MKMFFCLALIFFALCSGADAYAEPDNDTTQNMVSDLGKTLEDSLKYEQDNLKVYRERLIRVQREQIYLAASANGVQLQFSTYGNLLLSAGVDISTLQKIRVGFKSAMVEIQKMIDEISPLVNALALERKNLEQQKQLVEKQISEVANIKANDKKNSIAPGFEKTARKLASVLKDKEVIVLKLEEIFQNRMASLSDRQKAFSTLGVQFDEAIEQKETKNLFERNKEVFRLDALTLLSQDIHSLLLQGRRAFQTEFWITGGLKLWQSAGLLAVSFMVIIAGVLIVLLRIKASLSGLQALPLVGELGHWHRMTAGLLTQSILLGGMASTVYLYSGFDAMFLVAPALQVVAFLMLIYLVIRWVGIVVAQVTIGTMDAHTLVRPIGTLCRTAAVFTIICVLTHYILGQESVLLVIFRMTGCLWLLAWSLFTWRDTRFGQIKTATDPGKRKKVLLNLGCKYVLATLSCVALVFDMTGYGTLAVYWLMSWAQSLLILFWWVLLFALIQEWDRYYRKKSKTEREAFLYDNYPLQWLMIRVGQFVWLITLAAAHILAWGNSQTVLGRVYEVLAHPLAVGKMAFSLMGILSAVLVLLVTYALTRMWTWLFQYKFLSKSGMAVGLQDSITTITVYVIWMFGILISLHVFGLNTASLAVAFGALGIGLGFGLQNIFNNFISGIILLFERPIQVGDDVEINGTFAQVKKINVRSTLVQTYDNASLIIPNADFISSPVTNWSFKDKRLRRSVGVGVAYGSDVVRVRETLLEIAATTPKVLKYPEPDVHFRDFGDSALIFKLRVWTDIDNMLTVETDIRFQIYKLFKERDIEISFPQMDIHIRSAGGDFSTDPNTASTMEGKLGTGSV